MIFATDASPDDHKEEVPRTSTGAVEALEVVVYEELHPRCTNGSLHSATTSAA
jgi:hypothetical protein